MVREFVFLHAPVEVGGERLDFGLTGGRIALAQRGKHRREVTACGSVASTGTARSAAGLTDVVDDFEAALLAVMRRAGMLG